MSYSRPIPVITNAGKNRDLALIVSTFIVPLEETNKTVFGGGHNSSRGLLIRLLFGHYSLKKLAKVSVKNNNEAFVLNAIKDAVDVIDFNSEAWYQKLFDEIGELL